MKIKELLSEKKSPSKPRDPNFKTLQAKRSSGAAGAHKDKKKAEKQGDVKHKSKQIPVDEAGYFGGGGSYDRSWSFSRRNREDDWDEGNTEPPNNFAIYINGKKWKVFPGQGTYADDHREMAQLRRLEDMCRKKTEQTGKKWSVSRTGEAPTPESVAEKAPPGFKGTVKAMKKHKDIDNPFALAWSMKNKGYKSHKKADGSDK